MTQKKALKFQCGKFVSSL